MSALIHRYRLALLLALPVAVAVGLLAVPLVVLLRYSLYTNIAGQGMQSDTTLANYLRFFTEDYYQGSIGITLLTAVLVTAMSLVLAFPMAYVYARTRFGPKGLMLMAVLSPFYIDILVKIFAWMVLLGTNGMVNKMLLGLGLVDAPVNFLRSYVGILIILVYIALPYMFLSLIGPLQGVDETLVEAARVCGSPPGHVFWRIVLPLSIPGVLAGSVLVFSVGISSFLVPLLVGGKVGQQFLAVLIYEFMVVHQNWAMGSAAAMILLVTSLTIVVLYNRLVSASKLGVVVSERLGS